MDMPSSCSKCKFMYEFYGVKKCQLLNILENGGKAIISINTLTTGRKERCPLKPMPEKANHPDWCDGGRYDKGYNACIDEILGDKEREDC